MKIFYEEERAKSILNLTVAGTKDKVNMIECGADSVPEDKMLEAIVLAHEEIKKVCAWIEEIAAVAGKPKMEMELYKIPEDLDNAVRAYASETFAGRTDRTMDRRKKRRAGSRDTAAISRPNRPNCIPGCTERNSRTLPGR